MQYNLKANDRHDRTNSRCSIIHVDRCRGRECTWEWMLYPESIARRSRGRWTLSSKMILTIALSNRELDRCRCGTLKKERKRQIKKNTDSGCESLIVVEAELLERTRHRSPFYIESSSNNKHQRSMKCYLASDNSDSLTNNELTSSTLVVFVILVVNTAIYTSVLVEFFDFLVLVLLILRVFILARNITIDRTRAT